MSISDQSSRSATVVVDALFEIIDSGCWDDLPFVFAADSIYERPGYEPFVGLARIEHFYRYERAIGSGRHYLERVVGAGDSAACWGRFIGVSRTGAPLDERFSDTYEIRGAQIVTRRTYFFRPAI
jgi:uncharacterized protein